MKAAKVEGGVGKGKTATEAVDEDKLYDFNYDEQMKGASICLQAAPHVARVASDMSCSRWGALVLVVLPVFPSLAVWSVD